MLKTLIRIVLLALGVLVSCLMLVAQTVPVSTTYLQDGSALANGTMYWAPVLSGGTPTVYRKGSGGMATVTPIMVPVINGVSSIAAIPDSAYTTPTNLCWRVTLNTANGSSLLGSCVQPSASNYWYSAGVDNFDNWVPSIAPLPTIAYVQSVNGCTGVCTVTAGGITLTTLGSSGAATLIANVLNIPQYSGGGVPSVFGRTGAIVAAANDYSFAQISGSLAHAQLPTLLSGDIPNNTANTSGTASNVTSASNSTLTTLSALSLPYSQITSPPAIPTSSSWPNAGTCTTGYYVNAIANGIAPTCGVVQYSQLGGTVPTWNQNTTGNASTATALLGTPSLCTGGQVPTGILSSGNATGCFTPSGSSAFNALTSGTNTTAAMVVGSGASLGYTGTGTVNANQILGNTVPTLASGYLNWSGSVWQFVAGGGGTTTYPLTMNNSGAGAASGTPFNGGSAVTASYNTFGAAPLAAAGNLLHGRNQLQETATNQAYTRVCSTGDSIIWGLNALPSGNMFGSGYIPQLAGTISVNYGLPAYWDSFFGTGGANGYAQLYSLNDSRMVVGTSWTSDFTNAVPGGGSFAATTSTNALSFTPADPIDTFNIFYLTNSGAGTFQVTCTNCTTTTQSESGTQGIGKLTVTATGSPAINTLNITWYSGGQVNIWGVEALDSTRPAILVESMGTGGAQSGDWAVQTKAYSPGNTLPYSTLGCDIITYEDGINDWQHSVALPTFKTNVQTFITAALASGADVILETPPPANSPAISVQKPYVQALEGIAYTNSNAGLSSLPLPVIDLWDAMAGPISGSNYGWAYSNVQGREAADGNHVNANGYGYMSHLIANCLFSAPCMAEVTNDLAYTPYLTPTQIVITNKTTAQPVGYNLSDGTYTEGFFGPTCGSGQCTGLQLSLSGTVSTKLDGYAGSYFNATNGGVSIGSTTIPAAGSLTITRSGGTNQLTLTNGTNTDVTAGDGAGNNGEIAVYNTSSTKTIDFHGYSGGYINAANGGLGVGTTTIPGVGIINATNGVTTGTIGTTAGKFTLNSATAGGSTQLSPTAGVSTAVVLTLPNATDTLTGNTTTSTFSAVKTFSAQPVISAATGISVAPASAAGVIFLKQGTTQTTGTTAIGIQAPTSVTSYDITLPGSMSATVNNQAWQFSATASSVSTVTLVPGMRKSQLTAQYSNATATPSTIWSFSVDASTNYHLDCTGRYKAATGGAFELTMTGPATPTNLAYTFTPEVALATNAPTYLDYEVGVATTYPTSINTTAVTTAATDMSFHIQADLNNVTAGTWAIQGNTISTNTLNIEIGSTCTII